MLGVFSAARHNHILALPKSSSLLVTENSSVIRQLAGIIDQIDVPPAEVVSEFIKLERADASKVVDMLKDIFEKGNPQVAGQPGVRSVESAGRTATDTGRIRRCWDTAPKKR